MRHWRGHFSRRARQRHRQGRPLIKPLGSDLQLLDDVVLSLGLKRIDQLEDVWMIDPEAERKHSVDMKVNEGNCGSKFKATPWKHTVKISTHTHTHTHTHTRTRAHARAHTHTHTHKHSPYAHTNVVFANIYNHHIHPPA